MIIEVDEYKKKIPGYDPKNSELFHSESARLADKDFLVAVKSQKFRDIVFMAGGTASGKTEFALTHLTEKSTLVYDGTFKNLDGFQVKLKHIQKFAKNNPVIKIIFIIPEDTTKALGVFLKRERKMEHRTFFNTHVRSKISVARILLETDTPVEIYTSVLNEVSTKLDFTILESGNRQEIAKHLVLAAGALYKISLGLGLVKEPDFDSIRPWLLF